MQATPRALVLHSRSLRVSLCAPPRASFGARGAHVLLAASAEAEAAVAAAAEAEGTPDDADDLTADLLASAHAGRAPAGARRTFVVGVDPDSRGAVAVLRWQAAGADVTPALEAQVHDTPAVEARVQTCSCV